MYLRRFRPAEYIKDGEDPGMYSEAPNAFKVCSICPTDDPKTAEILAAVAELEKHDRESFRLAIKKLLKISTLGTPIKEHYDKKQCHEAFDFDYKGKNHTVWRIRNGDVRLLFFYGHDHIILLTDALAKRKDNLTEAEENRSKEVIKRYLNAKTYTIIEEHK